MITKSAGGIFFILFKSVEIEIRSDSLFELYRFFNFTCYFPIKKFGSFWIFRFCLDALIRPLPQKRSRCQKNSISIIWTVVGAIKQLWQFSVNFLNFSDNNSIGLNVRFCFWNHTLNKYFEPMNVNGIRFSVKFYVNSHILNIFSETVDVSASK